MESSTSVFLSQRADGGEILDINEAPVAARERVRKHLVACGGRLPAPQAEGERLRGSSVAGWFEDPSGGTNPDLAKRELDIWPSIDDGPTFAPAGRGGRVTSFAPGAAAWYVGTALDGLVRVPFAAP